MYSVRRVLLSVTKPMSSDDEELFRSEDNNLSATAEGRAALIAAVKANDPAVDALDWENQGVAGAELHALAEALPGNEHLDEIALDGNYELEDKHVRALLSPLLKSVVCTLGIFDRNNLSAALKSEVAAAELHNRLQVDPVQGTYRELGGYGPSITALNLIGVELSDEHLPALAEALPDNEKLLSLDIHAFDAGFSVLAFRDVLLPALGRCVGLREVSIGGQMNIARDRGCCMALQELCAPRLLAMLAANSPAISRLRLRDVWHGSFGDAEANALAAALEGNTHLQTIELPCRWEEDGVFTAFTAAGARALERVLGNGVCGVVCVDFHHHHHRVSLRSCSSLLNVFNGSQDRGDEYYMYDEDYDDDATLGDFPAVLRQNCFSNSLRRIRANDPQLDGLGSSHTHFTDHEMSLLVSTLGGNTNLKVIDLSTRQSWCSADRSSCGIAALVDVLPHCGLETVHLPSSPEFIAVHGENAVAIEDLCAQNKSRRQGTEQSIETNRPCQRLLLAAMCKAGALSASLSPDLMLLIAEQLESTRASPFGRAGNLHLPSHFAEFIWHEAAETMYDRIAKRRRCI